MKTPRTAAFTLIEMLAVLGIVAIIVGASSIYFHGAIQAMKLTNGSSEIAGALSMAQQIASSEGRTVEVRLYSHSASDEAGSGANYFRSLVMLRYYQPGEPNPDPKAAGAALTEPTAVVIGTPIRLASGIVIAEDNSLSSLIGGAAQPTTSPATRQLSATGLETWEFLGGGSEAEFRSFLIRPEGTSLAAGEKWFLTLVYQQDADRGTAANEIGNFACVQIDPVNGRVSTYRP